MACNDFSGGLDSVHKKPSFFPPESFYPTLLDCPGRKCVSFVTKNLHSFTGHRREVNLEERDGINGKVWWFGLFVFFLFIDKENLFYAEEL